MSLAQTDDFKAIALVEMCSICGTDIVLQDLLITPKLYACLIYAKKYFWMWNITDGQVNICKYSETKVQADDFIMVIS